jgi:hypothetical protein
MSDSARDDYETWLDFELREELDQRGLITEGKTAVLVARLRMDDDRDEEREGERSRRRSHPMRSPW